MRKVPNWSHYFMEIAKTVAMRSKDPNTQVGAVVVNDDRHIIGTGYNGFPPKLDDTPERWKKPLKYDLVIHAEMNAIAHATASVRGAKIYVTLHPCVECAKLICSAGISTVFYLDEKNNESEKKAKELFELSLVEVRQLDYRGVMS